jgi:hypothetical protein
LRWFVFYLLVAFLISNELSFLYCGGHAGSFSIHFSFFKCSHPINKNIYFYFYSLSSTRKRDKTLFF